MTTIHETVEEKQRWFREVVSLNRQNNRHLLNNTTDNITTTVGYPPTDQMTHPCFRSLPTLRSLPNAAQLKQIALTTSLIFPLHANSGTHHAYLYIGTPPQRQTLIIDTGSRITAFPCHPYCFDCAVHASKQFRLNASSSHAIVPCEECRLNQVEIHLGDENSKSEKYGWRRASKPCVKNLCRINQKYTEGSSWRAFEVRDRVWLGLDATLPSVEQHNKFAAPFVFGCLVSEEGHFKLQYADGIMGLSMYTQTLVGEWSRHGSIAQHSFSLCLSHEGGHISIGGNGLSHDLSPSKQNGPVYGGINLSPMRFTPFAKMNVWYYSVTVTSISVGAVLLPNQILQFVNDHKGTIVDSGTTDTFISHKVEMVRCLVSLLF